MVTSALPQAAVSVKLYIIQADSILFGPQPLQDSGHGGLINLINGAFQHRIEFLVRLLLQKPCGKRPGKACDQPVIPCQPLIGFHLAVTAGQRHNTHHMRIVNQLCIKIVYTGYRKLKHQLRIRSQRA